MSKILKYLGIAYRARKILVGEKALQSIKSQTAKLIVIANDASDRTKKMIENQCIFYNVKYIIDLDSSTISNAVGSSNIKYISVIDSGFAKQMSE